MVKENFKQQKRSGKAEFSGRRRNTTRKSGYKSHQNSTGGKYKIDNATVYKIPANHRLKINFKFPNIEIDKFSGFGIYFRANKTLELSSNHNSFKKFKQTTYEFPSWNKWGFIWRENHPSELSISFLTDNETDIEIYKPSCGEVWHDYFEDARENVIRNINIFSPEALFYSNPGSFEIEGISIKKSSEIAVKECNRCARFLPVNFNNERDTLSFSNHCVARRPCKHKGFGILTNADNDDLKKLEYGFQLECRCCKKFEVNAPLNPLRDANQMKEDSQRRRHFELLLSELYKYSKQLSFRHRKGKELTQYIWEKFDKKCFNCSIKLSSPFEMNLDHTRPLAFLWALDETATSLCKNCNSAKRDRFPSEFYTKEQLAELSKLTKIPLLELEKPIPNIEALKLIIQKREWLYSEFLNKDFLIEEKGGKIPAELICKSLDRVLSEFEEKLSEESFVEGWKNYEFS